MAVKIGINGFGRIGRNVLRASLGQEGLEIVAVNDITDAGTLAHLLKYDSVSGNLAEDVRTGEGEIHIGNRTIKVLAVRDPEQLPWKEMGVEIAVESTGLFSKREGAVKHIKAGAKKVLISAPAVNEDITVVMGVNENKYDPAQHHIISNASCTTNCLAPIAGVLLREFGVRRGFMTTIHAYTNDQKILDLPHKDLRRARAAGLSMIPTTTGAARAVSLVLPQLKGKLDGMAVRVPTPNVSMVDLVAELERDVTAESVNTALKNAAEGTLKGILSYCELPLVSIDFCHNTNSSIVDAMSTRVIGDRMVKVISWYDNEWGYSNRILDLVRYISSKGL